MFRGRRLKVLKALILFCDHSTSSNSIDNLRGVTAAKYQLAALGQSVLPLITALGKWGDDHQNHFGRVITQSARF